MYFDYIFYKLIDQFLYIFYLIKLVKYNKIEIDELNNFFQYLNY